MQDETQTNTEQITTNSPNETTQTISLASQNQYQTPKIPPEITLEIPDEFKNFEPQITAYKDVAKTLGLNQNQAQELLNFNHQNFKSEQELRAKQMQSWANEVKNDAELGGANFENSVMYAVKSLQEYDESGQILKMLEESGYSNHPEIIRFLSRIGKQNLEDTIVNSKHRTDIPLEERMYPNWKV